jgi:glycosyltransferase involved in cell wall biosynthesis
MQALPFSSFYSIPTVCTLHADRSEKQVDFCSEFPGISYIATSARQLERVPELDTSFVAHHGLDPARYPYGEGRGGYCAFLGRIAEEKGPHFAIDAARLAPTPLRIGGVPHWANTKFFDDEMQPRVKAAGRHVDYLGELGHEAKVDLLRNASALLYPIQSEEPFGLVMIESMLVGTPVIAFPWGGVPEIVDDGVTGFIVNSVREMAVRLRAIRSFDRVACRRRAEARWSATRMACDYERIYFEVIRGRGRDRRTREPMRRLHSPLDAEYLALPDGAVVGAGGLFLPAAKGT